MRSKNTSTKRWQCYYSTVLYQSQGLLSTVIIYNTSASLIYTICDTVNGLGVIYTWAYCTVTFMQIRENSIEFFPLRAARALETAEDEHTQQMRTLVKKVDAILQRLQEEVRLQTTSFDNFMQSANRLNTRGAAQSVWLEFHGTCNIFATQFMWLDSQLFI